MACVRLKRYLTNEPVEAIVVSHKRRRLEGEGDGDEVQTVFRYAGTVLSKDESVKVTLSKTVHLDKYKLSSRKNVKTSIVANKIKETTRNTSKENRYKLVSTKRGITEKSLSSSADKNTVEQEDAEGGDYCKLYDIEDYSNVTKLSKKEQVITCNGEPMTCAADGLSEPQYVYDLYYINSDNIQAFSEESVRIEFWDAITEQMYDNDDSDIYNEDDDSNDENYWANDYPDEDSDYEKDLDCYRQEEDDITSGFTTMKIATDSNSDDSCSNEFKSDSEDERIHGKNYAAFKKRMQKFMDDECEDSDEDYEAINNGVLMNPRSGNTLLK